MTENIINRSPKLVKKAYKRPQLKPLGSVRGLTLKVGSAIDSFEPNSSNFT